MRMFYEEWKCLDTNLADASAKLDLGNKSADESANLDSRKSLAPIEIADIPIVAFFSIGFSHHTLILSKTNNFGMTIPDYKRAFQAIQMFKDEYLLDYINVEQLGERDEDIDERVIENEIVHNVKNFIMTFGRGFSYMGNQVHYDKLGHDHWVDLLFFNRILKSLVVIELKKGSFKPAYLGQLAAYLRVLDDEERIEGENPSVGIVLCKDADRAYVEYVLQDYTKPMGVATYKSSQERLRELLPDEEEIKKLL